MHIKSYLLMMVFVLLPFAPLGFVGNQAYAGQECCECGQACGDCICNGTWPCYWCAAPNSGLEASEAGFPSADHSGAKAYQNGIPAAVLSSATEDMIFDIRGSNGWKGLMLKLAEIDKIKYDLKFSCPQAEEDYLQGNRLGLQVKAKIKK